MAAAVLSLQVLVARDGMTAESLIEQVKDALHDMPGQYVAVQIRHGAIDGELIAPDEEWTWLR